MKLRTFFVGRFPCKCCTCLASSDFLQESSRLFIRNRCFFSVFVECFCEPPFFTASSVFFATRNAIAAARKEHSNDENFFIVNSPLTPERIRMACGDDLSKAVQVGLTNVLHLATSPIPTKQPLKVLLERLLKLLLSRVILATLVVELPLVVQTVNSIL